MFVTWNGATEVKKWILQESDDGELREESWRTVQTQPKVGCETTFSMTSQRPGYIRVRAAGENEILGTGEVTRVSAKGLHKPILSLESRTDIGVFWFLLSLLGFATMSTVVGVFYAGRHFRHKRLSIEADDDSAEDARVSISKSFAQ